MFGAIQMVEANPTLTDQVVTALYKFVSLANTMLQNGEGVEAWTATRWEDFVITLQWCVLPELCALDTHLRSMYLRLYDFHPNGNQALLIDTMERLKWSGVPWEKVFAAEASRASASLNSRRTDLRLSVLSHRRRCVLSRSSYAR